MNIFSFVISQYKPGGALCELIGWLMSLFLLCDAGQKITDSTLSVSEAVYKMEWYSTDIQTMKDILFILMRSQKPMYLDALPLGILNYTLYLMLSLNQRHEFKIFRYLFLAKQEKEYKDCSIEGNKLVTGIAYGIEDLGKDKNLKTKHNSAPPTPTIKAKKITSAQQRAPSTPRSHQQRKRCN
ncbi:hypothetical protein JTB14_026250 [Gonioctena quinquepunctata]|nr:hypothetical protein JTB14_026250 [Gonioctena quinquepunctata]